MKKTFIIMVSAVLLLCLCSCINLQVVAPVPSGESGEVVIKYAPGAGYLPNRAELEAAKAIIAARLEYFDIDDARVEIRDEAIVVTIPGGLENVDFDIDELAEGLGEVAHLTFREEYGKVLLEGKHVIRATAEVNNNQTSFDASKYYIALEFSEEGAELFAEATGRLVGQPILICMDYDREDPDTIISAPRVNSRIEGGKAQITGDFTQAETKRLAGLINAGVLPFELTLIETATIKETRSTPN